VVARVVFQGSPKIPFGRIVLSGLRIRRANHAVVNFPPKQIGHFFSEVLTTGLYLSTGEVVLLHPERKVPNGAKLG
jgi:hypothetical protein